MTMQDPQTAGRELTCVPCEACGEDFYSDGTPEPVFGHVCGACWEGLIRERLAQVMAQLAASDQARSVLEQENERLTKSRDSWEAIARLHEQRWSGVVSLLNVTEAAHEQAEASLSVKEAENARLERSNTELSKAWDAENEKRRDAEELLSVLREQVETLIAEYRDDDPPLAAPHYKRWEEQAAWNDGASAARLEAANRLSSTLQPIPSSKEDTNES